MKLRDGLAGRLQNWGQIAFHPNPQLDLQFNRYCTSASMIETLHEVAGRVANVMRLAPGDAGPGGSGRGCRGQLRGAELAGGGRAVLSAAGRGPQRV